MERELALIGYGEAGSTFALAGGWSASARTYDVSERRRGAAAQAGLRSCETAGEAIDGCRLILSLVTADQALAAAGAAAPHVSRDTIYCDMNSVSPATKQAAAAAIEQAAGRYVDVAIMAPVNPSHLAVPLLLSGPAAMEAQDELTALGFTDCRVVGLRVGRASAVKMIRSVIVKGMEALTVEAMLAADAAGVVGEVLASLEGSDRRLSWSDRADYNLDRMMLHGLRRAAEMDEAAATLEDLGVEPLLTRGTAERQRAIGGLGLRPASGLDAKLEQLGQRKADAA
jgi:3-hydroxyisobutyrate dehydrogenase-like beta-hydroxyacid dehydrogenase